jgi:hypothetical protein
MEVGGGLFGKRKERGNVEMHRRKIHYTVV